MHLSRKKFSVLYTLNPEWFYKTADEMGAEIFGGKVMQMSEQLANGGSVFLEIIPGLSVFLTDMCFRQPVAIDWVSQEDLYIAYYDLGDEITTHLLDTKPYRSGYTSEHGMVFMDSFIPSSLLPPLDARSYSLRLIISKDLFKSLARNHHSDIMNALLSDSSKRTHYFYSHIDSRSKILLNQLRVRSIYDASFEFHLRYTALHLLAYLVERSSKLEPIINRVTDREALAIQFSAEFLRENLTKDFVGIDILAKMAGISISKYKLLFKKIMKLTPKQFYINEKLLLAQRLLQSGNFDTVAQVAYELGYSKPSYFISSYSNKFHTKPTLIKVEPSS